jgi:hypothetical protein
MNNVRLTESEVIDKLITSAKLLGEKAPRAIVVARTVTKPQMTVQRLVRIALVVTSNNETLIDGLVKTCIDNNQDFYFVGSEVNLQDTMEVDYLFFEATIYGKTE